MKKFFSFVGLVAAMTIQAASYSEAVMITMTCAGGSETQNVMLFPHLASLKALIMTG